MDGPPQVWVADPVISQLITATMFIMGTGFSSVQQIGESASLPFGGRDFRCDGVDESTKALKRADASMPSCCCRIRCKGDRQCRSASKVCAKHASCVRPMWSTDSGWATLKKTPEWWDQAPGVQYCKDLSDAVLAGTDSGSTEHKQAWESAYCDD